LSILSCLRWFPNGDVWSTELARLWYVLPVADLITTDRKDPTRLVAESIKKGKPVIFVAVNFRLNIFAFGDGNGEVNLALQDQRLAIRWVTENISAFGGDPVSQLCVFVSCRIIVFGKDTVDCVELYHASW